MPASVLRVDPKQQEKFISRIRSALVQAAARKADADDGVPSMREWVQKYRRIDGQPFSLESFKPLEGLYDDEFEHIVVIKPAQRGCSEWAVNRAIYTLDVGARRWLPWKDGLNVGYLFPTKEALSDFSKERLNGLKDEHPYLSALFSSEEGFDAVTFKQVGRSYLYLRGLQTAKAVKSFPADLLVFDEYDEMLSAMIPLAEKRLSASRLRHILRVSTPMFPGTGIDAAYALSDRRVWQTQCATCGEWIEPDFFRDVRVDEAPYADGWQHWSEDRIVRAAAHVACGACGARFDPCGPGRWHISNPEIKSVHGYKIPPLAFPFVRLPELCKAAVSQNPDRRAEFFRSDLGQPYDAAGARITEAMLLQLPTGSWSGDLPPAAEWLDTTMGVDVGARFHLRISSRLAGDRSRLRIVRLFRSVSTWDEVEALLSEYQVRQCVIDAHPELHATVAFATRHKGKVLRAYFPNRDMHELFVLGAAHQSPGEVRRAARVATNRPKVIERDGTISINRTMAFDYLLATIAELREYWPERFATDPEVRLHHTAPVRVEVTGSNGEPVARWQHTGPDHYALASLYDQVSTLSLPPQRYSALEGLAKIVTSSGY